MAVIVRASARLIGLACLLCVGSASADPMGDSLDRIARQAGQGIVRIEARRPWSSVLPDSIRPGLAGSAIIRVIGNGLVWDPRGYVVTVCDLAQPGDSLQVVLEGTVRRLADFVAQDAETGLSLIRVRGETPVQPIPRGNAQLALRENAWVLTLGATGRGPSRHLALSRVRHKIMTGDVWRARLEGNVDAALAGAGVLDMDGHLIGVLLGEGIESAILPSGAPGMPLEYPLDTDGPSEAGWVLPLEQMDRTVRFLLERRGGQGFLGVRVEVPAGTPEERARADAGLTVARVLPESPASKAGIRAGDRILNFGGQPVRSWDQLTQLVAANPPERPVKVDLVREDRSLTTTVRLADRGSMVWRAKQLALADGRERRLLRQIESLNQQLRLFRDQLRRNP
jgi:S1-C subfamily serine protease